MHILRNYKDLKQPNCTSRKYKKNKCRGSRRKEIKPKQKKNLFQKKTTCTTKSWFIKKITLTKLYWPDLEKDIKLEMKKTIQLVLQKYTG